MSNIALHISVVVHFYRLILIILIPKYSKYQIWAFINHYVTIAEPPLFQQRAQNALSTQIMSDA